MSLLSVQILRLFFFFLHLGMKTDESVNELEF